MTSVVHLGDCVDILRELPDASVDAVVTDPPYGLEFMGKEWDKFDRNGPASFENMGVRDERGRNPKDPNGTSTRFIDKPRWSTMGGDAVRSYQAWCEQWAREALRVLKPGGHALVFGGTRTYHRLASGLEDAGFEIRDTIAWMYGSGFPKSLDVSKAIDKRRDWSLVERLSAEILRARTESGMTLAEIGQATMDATDGIYGKWYHRGGHMFFETGRSLPSRSEWEHLQRVLPINPEFADVLEEAEREVIGTDRSGPAAVAYVRDGSTEFDVTAPATDDARTWQGWGTALKPAYEPIVVARKPLQGIVAANVLAHGTGALNVDGCRIETEDDTARQRALVGDTAAPFGQGYEMGGNGSPLGRWPANVTLDPEAAQMLDQQTGELVSGTRKAGDYGRLGGDGRYGTWDVGPMPAIDGDTGGASRFYYVAKTSRAERNAGLDGFEERARGDLAQGLQNMPLHGTTGKPTQRTTLVRNNHPTVKPIALMRWLVRLVTPPGGTVLDPFTGSGTTGIACALEGFQFIGIEREPDYHAIAESRIHWWAEHGEEALEEVRRQEKADAQREELAAMGQLGLFG